MITALFLTLAQSLAFPGAEGWGRHAVGGRGGDVYAVNSLDDDGPGTLRDALRAGHRTVIFRVSGTIELKSDLVITHSKTTIAGQTAPGDGICLRGRTLKVLGADDIVIRYLRVRPGDEGGKPADGIEIRNATNVILDHCSVSWSIDEGINTWHGTKNLTVQWCLVAEPLNRSVHHGPHGFGASWGGENASYHHNLFAHAAGRNPSVAGQAKERTILMDHRNSVIYNWEHRTCDGKPTSINVVNNYYKPGPATKPEVRRRICKIDDTFAKYDYESHWHIEGNVVEGAPELTADNWSGSGIEFEGNTSAAKNRALGPFPFAPVMTQSATAAYKLVLVSVGANKPRRDSVDTRVLHEVATGTASLGRNGIIDSQREAGGGWPELKSAAAPPDTDRDGMPDSWERARWLDPRDPSDRNTRTLDPSYTNLEVWLNSLTSRR